MGLFFLLNEGESFTIEGKFAIGKTHTQDDLGPRVEGDEGWDGLGGGGGDVGEFGFFHHIEQDFMVDGAGGQEIGLMVTPC